MPSLAIRRTRLEQLLDEHPDRQVVWVHGPVGAGKTVLLAQWVREQGSPFAWLSADSCRGDSDRLLRDVIGVVERLSADASDIVAARAESVVRHGIDHGTMRDLLDLLGHELGTRLTLVFDDVDQLRGKASSHVIRQLVEQPPEAARMVLVSRSKPPLGLERARLRGDLVEIPPSALRFDRTEIEAFVATWDARPVGAAELEQTTLGWAAGLRLAQLESASTLLNGSGRVTGDYVREELLDTAPKDLASFLEASCWLPVMTEGLRVALTPRRHRNRRSASYDFDALPTMPVASRPGTVRYPPILAHAVQQELNRSDPPAAATRRRRAAEACRRCGELPTAIELFLECGGEDEAADVCAELAATGERRLKIVDELLHELHVPPPNNARWLPWRIRAAVAAGHVDQARRLLEQADGGGTPAESDDAGTAELAIARAVVAEHAGDAQALLTCADRLVAADDPTPLGRAARRKAQGWQIRALAWLGDLEATRTAMRALEQEVLDPTPETACGIALARGWLAWLASDITTLSDTLAALPVVHGDDVEHERALLAAAVHRERGQLAKALPLAQQARTMAVASSHRVVEALAVGELARCHLAAGAGMDALELVVSTRSAHDGLLPTEVDARLREVEVRVRLEQGDVHGTRTVLRGAAPGVDTDLLAVRVALHEAAPVARDLLEAVDAQTPRQAVQKLLLYAQLPGIAEADASAALVAAISAGGYLGLVRTFLDEGPDVNRRLQRLTLESPDGTLGRLAALVSQELALAPAPGSTALVDPITPRELAVLRLLPLPMTNREIAAQMYISVNTLKTHVRAIYRKLDVSHRSAAVRRAKALQLV